MCFCGEVSGFVCVVCRVVFFECVFCGEYVVSRGLREGHQYVKVCACECVNKSPSGRGIYTPPVSVEVHTDHSV